MSDELIRLSASEAAAKLKAGEITPLDLMTRPKRALPRWMAM
jgi:hypothetical protein